MKQRGEKRCCVSVPRTKCRTLRGGLFLLLGLALCSVAEAQNQRPAPIVSSELGQENMGLVAASATDIKAMLVKDAGLMVEVKAWVAKDATDHGQIISEADLTNDAIFDRLETDIRFRSVATRVLQHYGYLIPKINPDSRLGKEQELLIQERVKWLAQDQEQELAAARGRTSQALEQTSNCDPELEKDCGAPSQRQTPGQEPGFQGQPGNLAPRSGPNGGVPSGISRGSGGSLEQARLLEGEENLPTGLPQSFGGGANEAGDTWDVFDMNPSASMFPPGRTGAIGGTSGSLSTPAIFGRTDPSQNPSLNGLDMGEANGLPLGFGAANAGEPNSAARSSVSAPRSGSMRPSQNQALLEPTEMARTANPYSDIPSLYDMYLQATPRPKTPTRFGMDVFQNGTRDPQLIPMDLPAGPDYVVGPGDGLAIDLWGGASQRIYRTVDREGRVSLPEVGPVLVSGKSLAEVQQSVQQVLRSQFRDVSADISLSRLRTIRVYVVGDVVKPGAYDISSLSTPLNALFSAGGPTARGSLRIVKHYRGQELVQVVDLYDLLLHGVKMNIERLENGDTVLVPPLGPEVTLEGMVRRPAIYELKDEKDLNSVLELAGGLLPTAALQHIEVQRTVEHEKESMMSLEIQQGENGAELAKQLASFSIQNGDQIRIFPIAPYNQDAVYLEGHVDRPGRYSYHSGMRVTDVISSYKDLLPEPAGQYAEIIRLNSPDFHPSVVGFSLADALADPANSPVLSPLDTVRVFSKFDFENPPTVSVLGNVRNPGTYRTSGEIRLSDAVHLAGGLSSDAQMTDAQVFRYMPGGKLRILSVSLSGALGGDPSENIVLAARDRLLIHGNPDEVQPSVVYVQGEVEKPGRYPLTTNMTVADLIRVGGGLKPSAYTSAGDLTRYQWTGQTNLVGHDQTIELHAALSGDPKANVALNNGDVLTIRQLPGWNDLGASITVRGEVNHPGTYGIRPGERLSSIIKRAGGFSAQAYPYGAILQRVQVRELEEKQQTELILRVKNAEGNLELLPETDPKQKESKEAALAQYQTTLTQLSSTVPAGRVAIRISSNIKRWGNTSADIEVRSQDVLTIPKSPDYVMVTGQVFNPTAVSYRPGKSAKWYLSQAGGPTTLANKKDIFVIRADGSVIGENSSVWGGDSLESTLAPGDTVVVPEKAMGGGVQWQNIFAASQLIASVTSTLFIALHY
jgi:protein involved in polysaccharide export with SLBB domain